MVVLRRMTRSAGSLWVLLSLVSVACTQSSSREYAESPSPRGGQTGSLRPCDTPVEASPTLPAGDAAFIFHGGCPAPEAFTLTDAEGNPLDFELETLENDVILLRAEQALTPGIYNVSTPDGSQASVTVAPAAPLPTKLGTLADISANCSALLRLDLDPAMLPYLPLVKLEYSVDGGPRRVWFEYGTVVLEDGYAYLAPSGVESGSRVTVFVSIAGETSAAEPEVQTVRPCASNLDNEGCALTPARSHSPSSSPGGVYSVLLCLWFCLVRRRARRDRS